jgi:hypothetical protein
MKCLLHIGTEKTGTTVIQDWLYHNRSELSAQRIFLSDYLGKNSNRRFAAFFSSAVDEFCLEHGIKSIEAKAVYFRDFKTTLSEEIAEAARSHDWFVISSEHLHSRISSEFEVQEINKFLFENFDDVKVIGFFRHQVELAISFYSTTLKYDSSLTFDEFLESSFDPSNLYFNYFDLARLWSSKFDKASLIFEIYDKEYFKDYDLRRVFFERAGLPCDFSKLDMTSFNANIGLSEVSGLIFREINERFPYFSNDARARQANVVAKDFVLASLPGSWPGIWSDKLLSLFPGFAESNRLFFREFLFKDEDLFAGVKADVASRSYDSSQVNDAISSCFRLCLDAKILQ